MSHFLARLVDRARGRTSRVEPVIPSRFAPTNPLDSTTDLTAPPSHHASTIRSPDPALSSPRANNVTADASTEIPLAARDDSPPTLIPTTLRLERVNDAPDPFAPLAHDANETSPTTTADHATAPRSTPRLVKSPSRAYRFQHDSSTITAAPSSPEPPIVRIHIGRIDVRATPTPAPTARSTPRSKKPALPLDEYLKARKDGSR